jgi:hypothetical protein
MRLYRGLFYNLPVVYGNVFIEYRYKADASFNVSAQPKSAAVGVT